MSRGRAASGLLLVAAVAASSVAVGLGHSSQGGDSLTSAHLQALAFRSIGPWHFGGRISAIAVPRGQSRVVYCGAASGGVWKTTNRGTTWTPVFDGVGSSSIGAIAVAGSNPNIVWVGTGEVIAGSHASWGDGIYKSTDAGLTWTNMGLRDSHYIGRIVIDPADPDVVYAAAVGHLWGPNRERGVFKTTDGGKSWTNTKFISEDVGFVDVVMDPLDHYTLYAAAYGRRGQRFSGLGASNPILIGGGGIYKTTDGGRTWIRLTNGLPDDRLGRIGLDVSRTNQEIVYAIVERGPAEVSLGPEETERLAAMLTSDQTPDPSAVARMRARIEGLVPEAERSAVLVRGIDGARLRVLLGMEPVDTGGGVFRSADAGTTWQRMNKLNRSAAYYSQILVDPRDPDTLYLSLERMWMSHNGGRTLSQTGWSVSSWLTSTSIHGDYHPFWIDPSDPGHFIVGTDGGLYSSYDGGAAWEAHPMPIGQFYAIAVDMQKPYSVYGGTQDNGGWTGPSQTRHVSGIAEYDWYKYERDDGAYVQIDPLDPATVYTSTQYGVIKRLDLRTGRPTSIAPKLDPGEQPLRFGFVAPFILSPHDHQTVYLGGQRVVRTTNRGERWMSISADLTKASTRADSTWATISTLAESPLSPGVLFVGTEDGNVHVTRDGGHTWMEVGSHVPDVPKDDQGRPARWVSRIEASHFGAGTAFIAFDGHRDDDFHVYLYRTDDFGRTWRPVKGDLPDGFPVRVVREDRANPALIFVGTEIGVFSTIDGGQHWIRLEQSFPTVRVDDLVIHPRDPDLVVGTHGRGIYVLDIAPLQQLTSDVLETEAYFFQPTAATLWNVDLTKNKGISGARLLTAPNPYASLYPLSYRLDDTSGIAPPGAAFYYRTRLAGTAVVVTIRDGSGKMVRELKDTSAAPGLNRILWDLRVPPVPLQPAWKRAGDNDDERLSAMQLHDRPGRLVEPGAYEVTIDIGGERFQRRLVVEPDSGGRRTTW